jgi:hypothetical protein
MQFSHSCLPSVPDWLRIRVGLKTRRIRYTGVAKLIFFRNQIVTNSCMVREIDIQTIKKEDIPFEAPFQLEVRRNDYIQVSIKGTGQRDYY